MDNDPLEALVDLTVIDGKPVFRLEQPLLDCPCRGVTWLGREWLDKRQPQCTCGAGDPMDRTVFHTVECDSVPCPFCPAEEAWRPNDLSDDESRGS